MSVPPGHFYSPIVDPNDPHVQQAHDNEARPLVHAEQLGLDVQEMERWFHFVAGQYPTNWLYEHKTPGFRYFYDNPNFPWADALALLAIMRWRRPKRYIEVGCGYSSAAAADINERYFNSEIEMLFIDPHPELALELLGPEFPGQVLTCSVQNVAVERFRELRSGDILFIDSSHVAKTGSDVLDLFFRVLPILRPGVLIHFHDIFFPFEYPAAWVGHSWNEAYFLRAFLEGNHGYRVFFFSDWIYKCRRELLVNMPEWASHRGGSLWMEKQR